MKTPRFYWAVWGALAEVVYLALAAVSVRFSDPAAWPRWPILTFLVLLGLASALYLWAMAAIIRRGPPGRGEALFLAVLFRLTLWPTSPILEDDIYRYLWDGKLVAAGLDPYRFSPAEVSRSADAAEARAVRDRSEANRGVLASVNHPEHRTIYPPPVELFFGCVALAVPAHWQVSAQVVSMKGAMLLFDLGALLALMALLEAAGLRAGWAAAYGWCPLVIKEFANSGHMDAIPTLCLALGLLAAARGRAVRSGIFLGLGAATKYFGFLALPLAALHLARSPEPQAGGRRGGARAALTCAGVAAAVFAGAQLLWPSSGALRTRALQGFLEGWEMNDLLFGWGVWALKAVGFGEIPATRAALAGAGLLIGAVVAREALRVFAGGPQYFLSGSFTVLGTAFLLSPVAFPWYFAPVALLLPFSRKRSWFLLPALLGVYYLRFWFLYHRPGPFLGFPRGVDFFDWVVVPAEFGVFFLAWGKLGTATDFSGKIGGCP